jgi:hypothetical protein
VGNRYEHCNNDSGSVKLGEFIEQLCDHQILKDSATWHYFINHLKLLSLLCQFCFSYGESPNFVYL